MSLNNIHSKKFVVLRMVVV